MSSGGILFSTCWKIQLEKYQRRVLTGLAQFLQLYLDQSGICSQKKGGIGVRQVQIIDTNRWVMWVKMSSRALQAGKLFPAVQFFGTNYSNHDCLQCARHCFNCFADTILLNLLIDPLREFIIPVLQMRKLRHKVVKQLDNLSKRQTRAVNPGGLARNPTAHQDHSSASLERATQQTIKDPSQMPVCPQCSKV